MITKQKIDAVIKNKLQSLLITTQISNIDEVVFPYQFNATLLYPTDDFLLTERQFNALTSLSNQNKIFIMQIGYSDNFLSEDNEIYLLEPPVSYQEYSKLRFDTITIMFSDSYDWIALIDESIEGGECILAGNQQIIKQFQNSYSNNDIIKFVLFQINDYKERQHIEILDHLLSIVKKLC